MHAWLWLIAAIGFEVAGTTMMKLSEGFSRLAPSIAMGVFYLLSLGALTMALKRIDVGVAYAIWAGLGTALIATIGVVLFGESVGLLKSVSIILIILGVVGLHLAS